MTNENQIRRLSVLTGVLLGFGWPFVFGRQLRDAFSIQALTGMWAVTVGIASFAVMLQVHRERQSRNFADERRTANGGRLLSTESYHQQLVEAGRELRSRWKLPALLYVATLCVTGLGNRWLHLLPQSVGDKAFFAVAAVGIVGVWFVIRDHSRTPRRWGLICPHCGATLFAPVGPMADVARTKRCGECRGIVLSD